MNIFIVFLSFAISGSYAKYEIEILEPEWTIQTPHNLDMFWKIIQPSRGVFLYSGYMDFKEDVDTDKADGYLSIYYSPNGVTYTLTPFRIPKTRFTDGMNHLYRLYMKEDFKKCCENPMDFEETFVSPITKRLMVCDKCTFNPDNFPSHLRDGFYKIEGLSTGELGFTIKFLMKLENV